MSGFLLSAFIYLAAAVFAVPIAKRLGLGSVLGYLIAGIVIGPIVGLVGSETQTIQHFAEFGVVMMLFLVGLELEPRALWGMRHRLLGLGGLQIGLTTLVVGAAAMMLGQVWSVALTIGLVFSLSSTAIVLQTLNEKGLMKSQGGQSGFSVLLFQDIAVIPMLALIPLLALPNLLDSVHHTAGGAVHTAVESISLVDGLPGWQVAIITVLAIAGVVVGGQTLSRPLFRFIAAAELREVFTAAALLLVIAIALLMTLVGLSPALGTFLAGVVLANSEYRHELESDIDPFKALLLGLFFITVGAGINFEAFFADWAVILGLAVGLMALKSIVLLTIAMVFGLKGADKWLFALGLAQAGEFGFVLLAFTVQNGVIPAPLSETLLLIVAISMLLTPLLFILFDKVILPKTTRDQARDADEIDETGSAIIAGTGRFGQVVNRILRSNGFTTVVLDIRAETVERLAIFGVKTFFGDASRPDLLHAAGLKDAKMLVVAIDDKERTLEIVQHARRDRPDIHIVARAYDREEVYKLYQAGANDIIRETFDSAVRAGRSALEGYGLHPFEAERAVAAFVKTDRRAIVKLASAYDPNIRAHENPEYIRLAREMADATGLAIAGVRNPDRGTIERAWMPPGQKSAEATE